MDGEIFVPVWDPLKCCCLCGQYNEDVQLGLAVGGSKFAEQAIDEEDMQVCYICYHSVYNYMPTMTVRKVLEPEEQKAQVLDGLNKFFQRMHLEEFGSTIGCGGCMVMAGSAAHTHMSVSTILKSAEIGYCSS